jgi:hypothetical protein
MGASKVLLSVVMVMVPFCRRGAGALTASTADFVSYSKP